MAVWRPPPALRMQQKWNGLVCPTDFFSHTGMCKVYITASLQYSFRCRRCGSAKSFNSKKLATRDRGVWLYLPKFHFIFSVCFDFDLCFTFEFFCEWLQGLRRNYLVIQILIQGSFITFAEYISFSSTDHFRPITEVRHVEENSAFGYQKTSMTL